MDYISGDNFETEKQEDETICGQNSVLLPGYLVTTKGIVEKSSGKVMDDVSIHLLEFSTRARGAICRWAMTHGKMVDNTVMLSEVLMISEGGIMGMTSIGKKTWDDILSVCRDYLTADRHLPTTETVEPVADAVLPDWVCSGAKLVHLKTGKAVRDVPISALNLNVRARNGLEKLQIKKISDFIGVRYEGLLYVRNLGVGTVSEIGKKLNRYLAGHMTDGDMISEEAHGEGNPAAELDIPKPTVPVLAEDYAVVDGKIFRRNDLTQIADAGIEILKLSVRGNNCLYACSILRKIFDAHNGSFREDSLAYLFENYAVEKELLDTLTEHNAQTIYYLEKRYTDGEKSIEEALDDKRLSVSLRRKIENWLNRDYFFADGEKIRRNRAGVEDFVVRKYCAEGCSYDTFCERYNEFLFTTDLPDEAMESLLVFDDQKRTRINRLADSHALLWGQNHHLRYYDVDSMDPAELLETLDLGRFENVEISTRKFMRDYPDLMERYDIRDEYELHNLLKKLDVEKKYPTLRITRMPILRFGTMDRDQLVKDMLSELAPISSTELEEIISEEYGHQIDHIKSNWFSGISEYYHQGVFSMDYQAMPEDHMSLLKENLTDDFYYFHEIKKIYRALVPDANISLISSYNLKRMGFRVNGSYAVQNFDSAEAYFTHLFTCKEIVDASGFHDRLKNIMMYSQVWRNLRDDYTIIEFAPMQYIHISKLQKMGITREDLHDFCDEVYAFAEPNSYFTMEYLRNHGFEAALDLLGFDTPFYVSVLREDRRFANWMIGHNTVFFAADENLCQAGNRYISTKGFIANYLQKIGSADIDELLTTLEDEFNLKFERHKIIEECKNSDLYYDQIMEKLYVNYDAYFEEI